MNIEEKAQRYDEAIERAKDFIKGEVHYALRKGENIMCWVFPELKESEDEKIRKECISIIDTWDKSCRLQGDYCEVAPKCIAWLEKQGEQKPIIEMKSAEESLGIDSDTYNKIVDECIYGNAEQNHAWSEEDEAKINALIGLVEEIKTQPLKRLEDWDGYVSWLKSLKDRVQPQPKQEWSKEDKEIIDYLIDYLESELDSSYTDLDKETFTEEINWLKSLKDRYTWKPSDEQLEALAKALSLAKSCGEENAFDLRTLYEQLKKIKG